MLFYVVVYDIPSDKRRKKVSDLLEGYGQRGAVQRLWMCLDSSQVWRTAPETQEKSQARKIVYGLSAL